MFAFYCICVEQTFSFMFCCVPVSYILCVCVLSVSKNLYVGEDEKQEIKLVWPYVHNLTTIATCTTILNVSIFFLALDLID